MTIDSNLIDYEDTQNRNMYGCAPCPHCKSKYRWPRGKAAGPVEIVCDECGYTEQGRRPWDGAPPAGPEEK